MSKHKYLVTYEVYVSTTVTVHLPEGATREQIEEEADRLIDTSICHQCADNLEVGDPGGLLEIFDATSNKSIYSQFDEQIKKAGK